MNRRWGIIGLAVLLIILGGYFLRRLIYAPALDTGGERVAFYIHTGWGAEQVLEALSSEAGLKHPEFARRLMNQKNYAGNLVVPGKYTLSPEMGLNELIDHLRAGNGEEEVRVTFNTSRTMGELAGDVSRNIETDSATIAETLLLTETAERYGFNRYSFPAMFIPDSYRMEWDTDAGEFLDRMALEYEKFWNGDRRQKAKRIGLSPLEVSVLASIVQAEQQIHPEERATIAGLYLNRLRRGMRLQSDPTVVFALGDFSINRVLHEHLKVESPYNTYLNAGLPPGPINLPFKQSIDAVLNAEEHRYLYMCAKDDFSGLHAFATSLSEHNRNARAFQRALNERKIYR
jgi:UPF0755 protein